MCDISCGVCLSLPLSLGVGVNVLCVCLYGITSMLYISFNSVVECE